MTVPVISKLAPMEVSVHCTSTILRTPENSHQKIFLGQHDEEGDVFLHHQGVPREPPAAHRQGHHHQEERRDGRLRQDVRRLRDEGLGVAHSRGRLPRGAGGPRRRGGGRVLLHGGVRQPHEVLGQEERGHGPEEEQ